jgi:hypothetical protein
MKAFADGGMKILIHRALCYISVHRYVNHRKLKLKIKDKVALYHLTLATFLY